MAIQDVDLKVVSLRLLKVEAESDTAEDDR
jgi:hypothetical protein